MSRNFNFLKKIVVFVLFLFVFSNSKNYGYTKELSKKDIINKEEFTKEEIFETSSSQNKRNTSGTWKREDGKWWYEYSSGGYAVGWEKIEGKWYHFDSDGWMEIGWINLEGKWYYLNDSGAMEIHWVEVKDKWYYLNDSGVMQTDWIKWNESWYYLNSSGEMQTGWQHILKDDYYFDSEGKFYKTDRRALILGETSTMAVPMLDVLSTERMMEKVNFDNKFDNNLKITPIISYPDKTKLEIINKIELLFKNSKHSDVNYIYMTCHGGYNGTIYIDSGNIGITGKEFRNLLDKYNGKFVLFIDCCFSGNIIDKSEDEFEQTFLNEFLNITEKNGELKNDKYIVFCSSTKEEASSGGKLSLATKYWLMGAGYDAISKKEVALKADFNYDSRVSVKELYDYSKEEVLKQNRNQHIVYYCLDSDFVIFAK